ncbi:MAG: 6-carboxytetrahydropterin synthase [Pseudomonadales bacterium]|nr:6-carboxytetrahydropterin synthase [Pseudomonadales bacterium]
MSTPAVTTIEISKDYLHFNSAHFTIFSATDREDLHGHTFYVTASIDCTVGDDGLAFDYNLVKTRLKALCDELDEKVLLPERSPHLKLRREADYLVAEFAAERIPFLPRDVLTLPVRNITVEELAPWLLARLRADPAIAGLRLSRMLIRVSSGPGQWAGAEWRHPPRNESEQPRP